MSWPRRAVPTMRNRKLKACLAACNLAFAAAIATVWSLALPKPAYAYVDPSVMTYTIQALAGVAVALSAVLGVAWRRLRKWLIRILKIDEKRIVEGDVHRVVDGVAQGVSTKERITTVSEPSEGEKREAGRPWSKRLLDGLVPSFVLTFSFFFFSPLEMVAGGEDQLLFTVGDVWLPLFVFSLLSGAILALLTSLFKGRAHTDIMAIMGACCVAAFAQALFLNKGMPEAMGTSIDWTGYTRRMLMDLAFWGVAIAVALWLAVRRRTLSRALSVLVGIFLLLVQTVSLGTAVVAANDAKVGEPTVRMTEAGLFSVSPKKNTIVFILDTFDTTDMLRIRQEDPSILDAYTGFTFYKNSTGKMIPTLYAIPFLLSNTTPQIGEDFTDWFSNPYAGSTFLSDINDAGFSVGIYSDDGSVHDMSYLAEEAMNVKAVDHAAINSKGAVKLLTQCGVYRSAPWIAKPFFWFYQDELNQQVLDHGRTGLDSTPYTEDDASYHKSLETIGLSVDDGGENGAFRFIHLLGAHAPYVLGEDGYKSSGQSDIDAQCKGSLKIVADYIQQLKDLGVYDNTTIIVTADHGRYDTINEYENYLVNNNHDIGRTTCPIWLVKPAQSAEEDAQAYKESEIPTGHDDYAATVIASVGGDYEKYGTPTWDVTNAPRERLYYQDIHDSIRKIDLEIQEYVITGDALDFSNWKKTDNNWTITPYD